MDTSLSGNEGENVEVCVNITSFPSGGVEIPVTLELGTTDGAKACKSYCISQHAVETCVNAVYSW